MSTFPKCDVCKCELPIEYSGCDITTCENPECINTIIYHECLPIAAHDKRGEREAFIRNNKLPNEIKEHECR